MTDPLRPAVEDPGATSSCSTGALAWPGPERTTAVSAMFGFANWMPDEVLQVDQARKGDYGGDGLALDDDTGMVAFLTRGQTAKDACWA